MLIQLKSSCTNVWFKSQIGQILDVCMLGLWHDVVPVGQGLHLFLLPHCLGYYTDKRYIFDFFFSPVVAKLIFYRCYPVVTRWNTTAVTWLTLSIWALLCCFSVHHIVTVFFQDHILKNAVWQQLTVPLEIFSLETWMVGIHWGGVVVGGCKLNYTRAPERFGPALHSTFPIFALQLLLQLLLFIKSSLFWYSYLKLTLKYWYG